MKTAERLIAAVRNRPYLYHQSLQTFRHNDTKNKNWIEVAKIVHGRDDKNAVSKIKMQWKSIRDAFVKQQRKRQSSQVTKTRVRPYIYENELQFLLPHILVREKEDSLNSGQTPSNLEIKNEDSLSLNASLSGDSQTEVEHQNHTIEDFLNEAQSLQQSIPEDGVEREVVKMTEMHPVDAFFSGMAQTVKRLKPATVAKLKKAVANLVMDAEIEEIESSEAARCLVKSDL